MTNNDEIAAETTDEATEEPQMREASALMDHWDGIRFGIMAPDVQRQKLQFEVLVDIRDHLQAISIALDLIAAKEDA